MQVLFKKWSLAIALINYCLKSKLYIIDGNKIYWGTYINAEVCKFYSKKNTCQP